MALGENMFCFQRFFFDTKKYTRTGGSGVTAITKCIANGLHLTKSLCGQVTSKNSNFPNINTSSLQTRFSSDKALKSFRNYKLHNFSFCFSSLSPCLFFSLFTILTAFFFLTTIRLFSTLVSFFVERFDHLLLHFP